MTNLWTSFEQRLRAIANGHHSDAQELGKDNQCAVICLNPIFTKSGALVGWYRPQVIVLEPENLKPLGFERVESWQEVTTFLSENKTDKSLLIRHGQPVAWIP